MYGYEDLSLLFSLNYSTKPLCFDIFVKSRKSRHSRENGSPEIVEKTGFPLEFTLMKMGAGMT